ncbi:hypothetical protein [Pyrococcus sp. ST04]|nr:hypothetical protein [Pyrococcus sp. ST04]
MNMMKYSNDAGKYEAKVDFTLTSSVEYTVALLVLLSIIIGLIILL